MGGEKKCKLTHQSKTVGSPPRGRGKVGPGLLVAECLRITPAWAGKRALQFGAGYPAEDHPRVGGEKRIPPRLGFGLTGSPPRGRGKGGYGWLMLTLTGITPAWAGKRVFDDAYIDFYYGSPPRRRGKVVLTEHHHAAKRITPAWAGKSTACAVFRGGRRDHPRVGGEKREEKQAGAEWEGSPPRGRGKGMTSWGGVLKDRITPAWAGKSV